MQKNFCTRILRGGVLIIVFNTMWDMLAGNFTYRKLWKRAIALLYGNYIWEDNASYIGVLWFLAALFCVSCLYELIHKFEKNNFRITIRVIYLFIFGVLIKTMLVDLGYRLPFCLDISLLVLPFYHLGYRMNLYLKEHKNMPRQRYYLFFSIFIFGGISGILNIAHMKTYGYAKQYVDVLYLNLGDLFLFLAAGCCISCSLLFLCKYIIKAECRFLKSCGRLSLLIMITHLYVLQIMRVVIDRLDIGYHVWMVAIILTSVSYIVSVCINRYFKWMFQFPFKVKNNLDMQ